MKNSNWSTDNNIKSFIAMSISRVLTLHLGSDQLTSLTMPSLNTSSTPGFSLAMSD